MKQYRVIEDNKGAFGITVTMEEIIEKKSFLSKVKSLIGQPYHVDEIKREFKIFIPVEHTVVRYTAMCNLDGSEIKFNDWKRFCNLHKLWRNKKGE